MSPAEESNRALSSCSAWCSYQTQNTSGPLTVCSLSCANLQTQGAGWRWEPPRLYLYVIFYSRAWGDSYSLACVVPSVRRVSLHSREWRRRREGRRPEEENLRDEEDDWGHVRHGDPQRDAPEERVRHFVCSFTARGKFNKAPGWRVFFFFLQAASSGHGAKGEAVEASPEPAGDLQLPPGQRPELFSGGEAFALVFLKQGLKGNCAVFVYIAVYSASWLTFATLRQNWANIFVPTGAFIDLI